MPALNYPTCKHCGEELVVEEQLDMKADHYIANECCIGICPKCKTKYQWVRTYDVIYRGILGFKEV